MRLALQLFCNVLTGKMLVLHRNVPESDALGMLGRCTRALLVERCCVTNCVEACFLMLSTIGCSDVP
jgi:hypothetical protein